ncbi:MAG: DUF3857 domain-containing transglutaminase family protein [Lysobacterales bacterium]
MSLLLRLIVIGCGLACSAASWSAPTGPVRSVTASGFTVAIAAAPDWVEPIATAQAWPTTAGENDNPRRVWLHNTQVDRRNGAYARFDEQIVQVMNPTKLSSAAQIKIEYEPNYQSLTIHSIEVVREGVALDRLDPDKITLSRREADFERQMYDGFVTAMIVLDDVRVGDLVRTSYTIAGANPILAGLHSDRFYLADLDPVLCRYVRVLADSAPRLSWQFSGVADLQPRLRQQKHAQELQLRIGYQAAVPYEADSPVWHPIVPLLVVGVERPWTDVVAWARKLYPPAPIDDLREILPRLRQLPDEEQRIVGALRWVQDEVRYFGVEMGSSTHRPAAPKTVLDRRFGDCKDKAMLLTTLLRAMDFEAAPALVSANRGRAIATEPASASAFDHAIVSLDWQGRRYWLDPTLTEQNGDLDHLGFPDYQYALRIAPDAQALEEMQPPPDYRMTSEIDEVFEAGSDGDMRLRVTSRLGGAWADQQRRSLASQGIAAIAKTWTSYYARMYNGARVEVDPVIKDDPGSNTLTIEERYVLPAMWTSSDQRSKYVDLDASSIAQYLTTTVNTDRSSPIGLPRFARIVHRQRLRPPAQTEIGNAPSVASLQRPEFEYQRKVAISNNELLIEHNFETHSDAISSDQLQRYEDDARKLRDWRGMRAYINLPETRTSDRQARLRAVLRELTRDPKGN